MSHRIPGFDLACRLVRPGEAGDYRVLRRLPRLSEIATPSRAHPTVIVGIVDTETTGLDPFSGELIEVAITILAIGSDGQLAWIEAPQCWLEQPTFSLEPKIEQITGLTDADLLGQRFDEEAIAEQFGRCHLLVSHNARFDRAFVAQRFGDLADTYWACSASELEWLEHGLGGRSLGHLLYEAGYFYEAHRAGPDCWALACLLAGQAGDGRTFAAHLIDVARQPSYRIYARHAPFAVKDRLKSRGYHWDAERRCWWVEVRSEGGDAECDWLRNLYPAIQPGIERVTARERHR